MTHEKFTGSIGTPPTNGNRITIGPWWGQLVRGLVSILIVAVVGMFFASMIRQQKQDDRLDNLEFRLNNLENGMDSRLSNLEDKLNTTTQLLYETRGQNSLLLKGQNRMKDSLSYMDSTLVEHDRKVMANKKQGVK